MLAIKLCAGSGGKTLMFLTPRTLASQGRIQEGSLVGVGG